MWTRQRSFGGADANFLFALPTYAYYVPRHPDHVTSARSPRAHICVIALHGMRWPIDDNGDHDLAGYLFRLGLGRQVRERLLLERRIAKQHGFACFADYYAARRAQGWGLDRLAQETGQTRDWVRGVMRRYGTGTRSAKAAEIPEGAQASPLR